MESGYRRSLSAFVLIILIFGYASENSNAGGRTKCYALCVLKCSITTFNPALCAVKCVPQCIFGASVLPTELGDDVRHCAIGCSVSKCTSLSTKDDPKAEHVVRCADGCLGRCVSNWKN
uniref:Thionin-like protein n=1 Tax=Kalanchoe fedtschenkoi TaxID=63787 RepID=A0A7N0UCF1_KALFE